MALSQSSVEKAYKVFNTLKNDILENLEIPSWPQDMSDWEDHQKDNPKQNIVYGWGRKKDNGWESISFFVEDPSEELKGKFEDLQKRVPNSAINEAYHRNKNLWVFGWF